MGKVTLLALDVDGTLVGPDGVCSEGNRRALASAVAQDIEVIFVTARPPRTVAPLAQICDLGGKAICSLGAVLYDLDTGTVVRSRPLSADIIAEVIARLRDAVPGVTLGWETAHGTHVEAAYPLPVGTRRVATVADPLTGSAPILHLFARAPSGHESWIFDARDSVAGLVETAHWSSGVLDLTALGVTKQAALQDYCDEKGVPAEGVLAIGDTEVDAPMMEWAGVGVAVGDAPEDVRAAADWVVAACGADGVAEALTRLTTRATPRLRGRA